MLPQKIRVRLEQDMKDYIAAEYCRARASAPWSLDHFVLRFGPDLQRHPWKRHLFPDHMLCEIDAVMAGPDNLRLYTQLRDQLDLLQLQRNPITPPQQRAISQHFKQKYGLYVLEHCLVDMTDADYRAAIKRLAALLSPGEGSAALEQYVYWMAPSVLSTREKQHRVPVRDRKTLVTIQPLTLAPEPFLWWFRYKLVRAIETRFELCPYNPLWHLPNGLIQGSQRATKKDFGDLGQWFQAICGTAGPGRRPGPDGFEDAQEFEDTLVHLIQVAYDKGLGTKQKTIAILLGPVLDRRRGNIGSAASVDTKTDSTQRLIRKHLSCSWPQFVKKSLRPR